MNKDSVLQWVKEPNTTVCITGGDAFRFAKSIDDGSITIKVMDNIDLVDLEITGNVQNNTLYILTGPAVKLAKRFDHWLMTMKDMGCYGHVHKMNK